LFIHHATLSGSVNYPLKTENALSPVWLNSGKCSSESHSVPFPAVSLTLLMDIRPEKDHMLQLQSFAKLLANNPSFRDGEKKTCLVLIGSSRNEGDENRIQSLRMAAKELDIEVTLMYAIELA